MEAYSENLLVRLAETQAQMTKSEKKVAEVVLADPAATTRSSIATLARAAGVSEPSVNRFCKNFGAAGFPDFKLKLAQCMASGFPLLSESVEPGDDLASCSRKILSSTMAALAELRESLDTAALERGVSLMTAARRIYFFGLGASSAVAKDAEQRFFRFKLPVSSHEDMLMQRMLAASAGAGDLFVMISHTGRTRELIDTARLARQNGAVVMGLTAPASPLAGACNCVVGVEVVENTDYYMPMNSRIAHLAVLDILAAGITLKMEPDLQDTLKKVKDSLKATRVDRE